MLAISNSSNPFKSIQQLSLQPPSAVKTLTHTVGFSVLQSQMGVDGLQPPSSSPGPKGVSPYGKIGFLKCEPPPS